MRLVLSKSRSLNYVSGKGASRCEFLVKARVSSSFPEFPLKKQNTQKGMDVEKLVGILVGGIGFLLAYHYYIKSTHSTKAGPRPSVWKFRAFLLVLSIASWYAIVVPSKPQKFISINDIKIIIKNPMETTNVLPESPWNEHGYVDTGFGKTHYYLIGNPSDPKLV